MEEVPGGTGTDYIPQDLFFVSRRKVREKMLETDEKTIGEMDVFRRLRMR